MATAVSTPIPVPGSPQPPVYPLIVGNNGGFMAVRASSAQGSCGASGYPCKHPGVDVNVAPGRAIASPVSGVIVQVADGSSAPFSGYGPYLAIIHGDDDGLYHLVAHMAREGASLVYPGRRVVAGDKIGIGSGYNHVHWELRKRAVPLFSAGESNATNNLDPIAWLSSSRTISKLAPVILLGTAAVLFYLLTED